MLPHGWDEGVREVDAHLPDHALRPAGARRKGKPGVGLFCKRHGPPVIERIPGESAHLMKGVHPFGQVVIVLPVPVPFQTFIKWIGWQAFVQGLADPQPLLIAVAAQQAAHFVGMPECTLNLAEAVIYLATAPKSNSSCEAYMRAQEEVKSGISEPVPIHLRNAVTALMKNLGYGKDYKYSHNYSGHFIEQQFLPDTLKYKHFYTPGEIGYEKTIATRLKQWWQERKTGRIEEKGQG